MACKGGVCSTRGGRSAQMPMPGGNGFIGGAVPAAGARQSGGGGNFFTGKKAKFGSFPIVTGAQSAAMDSLLRSGLGGLEGLGGSVMDKYNNPIDPYEGFDPIANLARENFSTQTIPSLAERFTSLGSGGSQRSSAFQGALGAAAANLEKQLAALRSEYGLQNKEFGLRERGLNWQTALAEKELAQRSALSSLGYGLQPQFENTYTPGKPGFLQSLFGGAMSGLGSLAGGWGYGRGLRG